MLFVKGISDRGQIRKRHLLSNQAQSDHKYSFELKRNVIATDQVVGCVPVNDFNQSMNQKAQFLKKRISELNSFVVKLNIFAELTSQELNKHLSFESSMPRFFHMI